MALLTQQCGSVQVGNQQSLWAQSHAEPRAPKMLGPKGAHLDLCILLEMVPERKQNWPWHCWSWYQLREGRTGGTRSQLSWLPGDLGTGVNQEHNCRAENHPKNAAVSPSNLVKQKPCMLWISLSYYYGPRHIWRGKKCKIKLLKYNLHQWERKKKKKTQSLFY